MKLAETLNIEYLSKLENLNIAVKSRIAGRYNGLRKSSVYGNSTEFAGFRNYSHGDDVKYIDWNSYARLNKLFIKTFYEEKQANINIIIDNSKSMDFGIFNKGDYAKLTAASFTYIALKNTDRVNIYCVNDEINIERVNLFSKNLFYNAVEFLDSIEFEGRSNINKTLLDFRKKNMQEGTAIIISDFLTDSDYKKGLMQLQYLNQSIIVIHLLDESEINPCIDSEIVFIDSETKSEVFVPNSKRVIQEYKNELVKFKADISNFCRSKGMEYHFLSTRINPIKFISQIL